MARRTKYASWSARPSPRDIDNAALRLLGWMVWIPLMAVLIVIAWPVAAAWAVWKVGMAGRRRARRNRGLAGRTVWGER